MPTRGIRMSDEFWNTCLETGKKLGYEHANDFVRDAIEFYIEWRSRDSSEKFLTPALESVVRGIIKDSEDRIARLLFKQAVDIDMLARLFYHDYNYTEADWKNLRRESVRTVSDTNGTIHLGEKE